jgi:hypothetical protein
MFQNYTTISSGKLLLVLASTGIPISESRRNHDHALMSQISGSPAAAANAIES